MKGRQGIVDFIKGKKQQDSKGKTGFFKKGGSRVSSRSPDRKERVSVSPEMQEIRDREESGILTLSSP